MTTTVETVKITTKIVVQHYSNQITNKIQPRTWRTWTTDDLPHWCSEFEMPIRSPDGEYVGASSTDECEKCMQFLRDLFAAHQARLPDGCNHSGTMEHVVDVPEIPKLLSII